MDFLRILDVIYKEFLNFWHFLLILSYKRLSYKKKRVPAYVIILIHSDEASFNEYLHEKMYKNTDTNRKLARNRTTTYRCTYRVHGLEYRVFK